MSSEEARDYAYGSRSTYSTSLIESHNNRLDTESTNTLTNNASRRAGADPDLKIYEPLQMQQLQLDPQINKDDSDLRNKIKKINSSITNNTNVIVIPKVHRLTQYAGKLSNTSHHRDQKTIPNSSMTTIERINDTKRNSNQRPSLRQNASEKDASITNAARHSATVYIPNHKRPEHGDKFNIQIKTSHHIDHILAQKSQATKSKQIRAKRQWITRLHETELNADMVGIGPVMFASN